MRKIYNYILVTALCLSSVSCDLWSDVDEAKPYYKQTEEALFSTAEGIEQNVSALYGRARGGTFLTYTIKYNIELSGLYSDARGQNTDAMKGLLTVDDVYTDDYYLEWYQLIMNANLLIKNLESLNADDIPGFSEERRSDIIGEAKFGRAMGHFELLKLFGQHYDINSKYGIPVVTSILEEGPARGTVADVYKLIEEDLDDALLEAPEANNGQLFTQQTARALRAKVALYKKDYATASSLALEIINNGGYRLEESYSTLFTTGLHSQEIIFAPNSKVDYTEYVNTFAYMFNAPTPLFTGLADSQVEGEGVFDPRYAQSLYGGKFPWGTPASFFYLRLAEMYFIYAEAQVRMAADGAVAGDVNFDNALAKVNTLRDRVSILHATPANKAELLETIRVDKAMELNMEFGETWFDLVRYHFYGDVDISTYRGFEIKDYQLIYPFNLSTLSGNSKLEQNPGYIGAGEE